MRCPNCGFEGEGRFCAQCGTPMEEMNIVSSEDPAIPVEERRDIVDPVPEAEVSPVQHDISYSGEAFYGELPRKQGAGSRFGAFWHKNKRNKVLVIIAALIVISIVRSIIGGIGSPDIDTQESYDWPANDMAQMIPEPEGTLTYVSTTNGEYLNADVNCTEDQYRTFIDGCKEMGFDKKQDVSQYEDSYDYAAENKDAYKLTADYYDGQLSIYLNAPEEDAEETEEPEETKKETTEATKEKKSSDEVSPDFKETMDDYEAFMNDYVEFMKKYENSDDTASMLVDYGKMMTKYAEFTEKIDAIDEDELSDADYAYYMKVTGRVTEKLAELY